MNQSNKHTYKFTYNPDYILSTHPLILVDTEMLRLYILLPQRESCFLIYDLLPFARRCYFSVQQWFYTAACCLQQHCSSRFPSCLLFGTHPMVVEDKSAHGIAERLSAAWMRVTVVPSKGAYCPHLRISRNEAHQVVEGISVLKNC